MILSCNYCDNYFKGEKAIERLKEHQENCTKNKPFINDEKSDGRI